MHGLVRLEMISRIEIEPAFIGMQSGLARDVLLDDPLDRHLVGNGNMERAHLAAALDQREDGALVGGSGPTPLRVRRCAWLFEHLWCGGRALISFLGLPDPPLHA